MAADVRVRDVVGLGAGPTSKGDDHKDERVPPDDLLGPLEVDIAAILRGQGRQRFRVVLTTGFAQ